MSFGYQNEFSLGAGEYAPAELEWAGYPARGGCCSEDCAVEYFDVDDEPTTKAFAQTYRLKLDASINNWRPTIDGNAVFSWGEYTSATVDGETVYTFSEKTATVVSPEGSSVVTPKYPVPDLAGFWGVTGPLESPRPRITLEIREGDALQPWAQPDGVFYAPNDHKPTNYRLAFAENSPHAYRDLRITIAALSDFVTHPIVPMALPTTIEYRRKDVDLEGAVVADVTVSRAFDEGDPLQFEVLQPASDGRIYVFDFVTQESTRRLFGQVKSSNVCL